MIIVNDSPEDDSYVGIEAELSDKRITYVINEKNMGVNFSRNRALELMKPTSDSWVIFLDDDDYLAPNALSKVASIIAAYPGEQWLLMNRAYPDGKPVTVAYQNTRHYFFVFDILFLKKIKGDPTHCIKASSLLSVRFPKTIKQGEEWLFFYELGCNTMLFYYDYNCTLTDGYQADGLNLRQRSLQERLVTIFALIKESNTRKLLWRPSILLYFAARFVLLVIAAIKEKILPKARELLEV